MQIRPNIQISFSTNRKHILRHLTSPLLHRAPFRTASNFHQLFDLHSPQYQLRMMFNNQILKVLRANDRLFHSSRVVDQYCSIKGRPPQNWHIRRFSQCKQQVVQLTAATSPMASSLSSSAFLGQNEIITRTTELKAERRNMQQQRFEMAQKKRESARKKVLAQDWMRIFASSHDLFQATLKELKVEKEWSATENDNHTVFSEYRQFYLDSLPSFWTLFWEDPESNDDIFSQLEITSDVAFGLLEKFDKGGFSDQAFLKKFRSMIAAYKRYAELQSSQETAKKNYAHGLESFKDMISLLHKTLKKEGITADHLDNIYEPMSFHVKTIVNGVYEELNSIEEEVGGQSKIDEKSAVEHIDKSCQDDHKNSEISLITEKDENSYNLELDRLEKVISDCVGQSTKTSNKRSLKKSLLKQARKVKNSEALLERLSNRVSKLETEINELKWPLSHSVFQTAKKTLTQISSEITPLLAKYITIRHSDFEKYRILEQHTDMTKPHEWYPHARLNKRKVIFHAGPTNSGKTYNALLRLKQAKKGMYLAPLRLLAAECYENLTADGIYTDLITGQEQRNVPFSTHRSSTVELACLDEDFDVVVIDEIQMLCDSFRGFAWTRALMGVRCKEIHVCGGAEAHGIVKKISYMCGDDFEIKMYSRFGELKVLENSLAETSTTKGSYAKVQPGDCVVAFSRYDIFAIKREIEQMTPYKCCVIYGSLPPAIRTEQARRFNDPNSDYEVLVASDAIGMGLNLSIKRIIFNSIYKNDGEKIVQLDHSLVKQIAGRAGRRNSPYPNGEVTCRDPLDMDHLRKCLETEVQPIQKAGLIPTPSHIGLFDELLRSYGSSTDEKYLHQTLRKFSEMATLQGDFFLCRKRSMEVVSRLLKDFDMSSTMKFMLCMSPVNENCPRSKAVLLRYMEKYTSGKVPGIHRSMRPQEPKSFENLAELCSVHHELDLFLWLNTKFPSNAVEQVRALSMKEEAIEKINFGLSRADKLSLNNYDYISKDVGIKKMMSKEMRNTNAGGQKVLQNVGNR